MPNRTLKMVCSLAAIFGVSMLVFLPYAINEGFYSGLQPPLAAAEIGATILRAGCFILCMWAAWRNPPAALWFAWGAFATFAIGASLGRVGHLQSMFYIVLAGHGAFVAVVRYLTPNGRPPAVAG